MGIVSTNNVSLSYAIERTEFLGQDAGLKVLPVSPEWKRVQPNQISTSGASNTTTQRRPISSRRQNLKPIITDRDVAVEYDTDLTSSSFDDHIEGFMFAKATNNDLKFRRSNTTSTGYTIAAANASQAQKLQYTAGGPISLLYAVNYVNGANNGLKELAADVATTDTEIQVTGMTAETAAANAQVEIAGIRPEVGDLSIVVSGVTATLTSGNNGAINNIDFTTIGLTVGQFVHIGGLTGANQFSAGYGYGRITAITSSSLSLDKISSTLATDTGAGETVDLLFGNYVRNVNQSDPDFLERSYQFEVEYPGLGSSNETMYNYLSGAMASEMTVEFAGQDKATCTFSFIAAEDEGLVGVQKTNANNPVLHAKGEAFSTSADFARLRIADLDDTGLTTDFQTISLTINNEASAAKVLNTLGARFIQFGNNSPSFTCDVLFTNAEIYNRVNSGQSVTADVFAKNSEGGIYFDFPSLVLSDGSKTFSENETVTVSLTGEAFIDSTLGISIGISTFAILP